jgi:hypothetical protein
VSQPKGAVQGVAPVKNRENAGDWNATVGKHRRILGGIGEITGE